MDIQIEINGQLINLKTLSQMIIDSCIKSGYAIAGFIAVGNENEEKIKMEMANFACCSKIFALKAFDEAFTNCLLQGREGGGEANVH